jgi:cardiolipin synthase (CMP-forming)
MSKFNTFLQLALIGATTALPLVPDVGGRVAAGVVGLQWVVLGTTMWSGGSYVWRKDVVKILGTDEELKRKQGFRGRMILGSSFASFLVLAAYLAGKREDQSGDESTEREDAK